MIDLLCARHEEAPVTPFFFISVMSLVQSLAPNPLPCLCRIHAHHLWFMCKDLFCPVPTFPTCLSFASSYGLIQLSLQPLEAVPSPADDHNVMAIQLIGKREQQLQCTELDMTTSHAGQHW